MKIKMDSEHPDLWLQYMEKWTMIYISWSL